MDAPEPKKIKIGQILQEHAEIKSDMKIMAQTVMGFTKELGIDLTTGNHSIESFIMSLMGKIGKIQSGNMKSLYEIKALGPLLTKYAYLIQEDNEPA